RGCWYKANKRSLPRTSSHRIAPSSDTIVRLIGPYLLHIVLADHLELPGTDITNLPIVVIVPPLARNRIGDGFGQFMRGGACQGLERRQPTEAAGTPGIGHH